jgi:hypothetical protein
MQTTKQARFLPPPSSPPTDPTRSGLQSGRFRINLSAVVGAGWDLVDQPPPHRTLLFLVRSINVGLLDGFSTRIVEHTVANGDLPVPWALFDGSL